LSEEDYSAVAEWASSDRFSDRERAGIEFAELFVADHLSIDDEVWLRLKAHWSDVEIMDLCVLLASFLGLGRLTQVLDPETSCALEI